MKKTALSLALALTFASQAAIAADKKKEDKKEKTIASLIENKTAFKGVFELYQDKKTGEHLLVLEERF